VQRAQDTKVPRGKDSYGGRILVRRIALSRNEIPERNAASLRLTENNLLVVLLKYEDTLWHFLQAIVGTALTEHPGGDGAKSLVFSRRGDR